MSCNVNQFLSLLHKNVDLESLVVKNSRNGKFLGYNSFPKCKYIEQINKE